MSVEVVLVHGIPRERDSVTYVVRSVRVTEEIPVSVDLVVAADQERDYLLGIGDTFPVREETWALDRVENLLQPDWRVVLRKVE
ncbi:DUF6406 domain-containing protein [Streptomyces sp. NPDC087866]|uniref:DUF6406 domain-containing protein n=1 Tax=unclassified Streptomyces TaxID=2593676 RepID=UPI0033A71BE5